MRSEDSNLAADDLHPSANCARPQSVMRPRHGFLRLAISGLTAAACSNQQASPTGSASGGAASVAQPAEPLPSALSASAAPKLTRGELASIPGGAFQAGTQPGTPGRDPELEPRMRHVELGPFRIDRLPYPNDPAKPPRTGVTRAEAAELCSERRARLCSELEWERACKGDASFEFSTGARWAPRCAEPSARCASPFDVYGMGSLMEWTASDVLTKAFRGKTRAAVRGAEPGAPSEAHRCAARRAVAPEQASQPTGFRCCEGPPNGAVVDEPELGETFEKVKLTAAELEAMLAASSHTKAIAHDVVFFREPDAAETVVARGPGDRKGFSFTVSPLLWNPVAGARYLLVPARSGDRTSFVAAFHVLEDGKYALMASFIMEDEAGPVAFAYDAYIRPRLHFSTCWGCPGETGKILYRDHDRASILQP